MPDGGLMDLSSMERDRGSAAVLLQALMCSFCAIRRCRVADTPHRLSAAQLAAGGVRRAALALAPVVAGLVLWSAPAVASTLVIEGAGDGHGVGMSQDGALGYSQHGWSDTAILAHYYTGTTLGQAPASSVVKVLEGAKVVRVPLERYVRGVVSAEMPSNWPLAALEAQAIASRTYALTSDAGGARFDVYADTRSQMYLGTAAETATTNTAVAATAGQIVEYAGKPAITYYFASSGGMTEDVQNAFLGSSPEPWLQAVPDSYETKSSSWKLSIGFASAAARLSGLVKGSFRGIEVLKRGISPRIIAAEVLGSRGNSPVSGPDLAARLGLTSTWAYFSVKRGARVTREPDHSGQAPFAAPPTESPPAAAPLPSTGAQGGNPAPVSTASTASAPASGGVAAE
jgi:stage II sporulation protein D